MEINRILIFFAAFLIIAVLIYRITPQMSKLQINPNPSNFPEVSGYNLDRKNFVFPRDFAGDFNLVIVPFQRYHQDLVDTWIPTAQQIEAEFPGFIYYELPTIRTMSGLSRTFLNEGMRAGIPDQTSRERTVTLYLDKERFRSALDIPNENTIHLYLVAPNGEILWRTTGEYSTENAASLLEFLNQNRGKQD